VVLDLLSFGKGAETKSARWLGIFEAVIPNASSEPWSHPFTCPDILTLLLAWGWCGFTQRLG
jgi:hypothetical protein